MLNVICDICKKHIPGAMTGFVWDRRDANYKVVLDKAICPPCYKKFEEEIKDDMGEKSEFGFLDHNRVLKNALDRMTQ